MNSDTQWPTHLFFLGEEFPSKGGKRKKSSETSKKK
jgi:hypothetical protein